MNQVCNYLQYGDESVLEWRQAPIPILGPNELIVRVAAVSVNPIDWKIMAGEQILFTGKSLRRARVFGSDFSGIIVGVGKRVSAKFKDLVPGTPVMGMVNPLLAGSFQKFLAVRANQCVQLPSDCDLMQAAGLPAAGLTAWRTVNSGHTSFWQGKKVLLNAAGGGVGSLILQLLAQKGARVIATASLERHAELLAMGASVCIDYQQHQEILLTSPWDSLIDCHGSYLQSPVEKLLVSGGRYFPVSIPNDQIMPTLFKIVQLSLFKRIHSRLILAAPSRHILTILAQMLGEGQLKVPIDSIYPANDLKSAVRQSISGHAKGKIIVNLATLP